MNDSAFRYYLESTGGLRRYIGADGGERREGDKWVGECAPERACQLTGDTLNFRKRSDAANIKMRKALLRLWDLFSPKD